MDQLESIVGSLLKGSEPVIPKKAEIAKLAEAAQQLIEENKKTNALSHLVDSVYGEAAILDQLGKYYRYASSRCFSIDPAKPQLDSLEHVQDFLFTF